MSRDTASRSKTQAVIRTRIAQTLLMSAGALMASAAARATQNETEGAAQDDQRGLVEIVVTARRVAENLQTVPVAISVVTDESLHSNSIVKFEDIARAAPGFSSAPGVRGSNTPSYTIRGQRGASTQTQLLDPAVSVYMNEFNLSRSTGTNQLLFDLDSLQILKGPQGTLFGRNSTGGAVLITTHKPTDEFGGYVTASAGNFEFRDQEGVINLPMGDMAALRVGGKISRRDGYLHNVITGQRPNDLDAEAARVSLVLNPSDNFESLFVGTYFHGGGVGTDIKLTAVAPSGVAAYPAGARPVMIDAFQRELERVKALDYYQIRNNLFQHIDSQTWTIQNNSTLELGETALGDLTLKNIIGYKDVDDAYNTNQSGSVVDVFFYDNDPRSTSKGFSEEIQLQGKTSRLTYVLGAYYFRETGTDKFTQVSSHYLVSDAVLSQLPAASATTLLASFPGRNYVNIEAKAVSPAVFFHGAYALDGLVDGLTLSGGARQTWDERHVVWHNQTTSGSVGTRMYRCSLTGVVLPAVDPAACAVDGRTSVSAVTYDVSLDYKLSDRGLIYLAHRRGYRSGGFNIVPPPPPIAESFRAFKPETVRDIEIGLKTDFHIGGAPGRFNIAGYYQWYDDVQRTTGFQISPGAISSATINVAKLVLPGAEAELTFEPFRGLELTAGAAIVRADYKEWTDFYVVNGAATAVDVSDSPLAYVPEDQFSASARLDLGLPPQAGELSAFASIYYQSGFSTVEPDSMNCGPNGLFRACVGGQGRLSSYTLVNARLDWNNMMGTGVDLGLFVNNLTDRKYAVTGVNGLQVLGQHAEFLGPPRMFGAQLRVGFGAER